MANDHWPFSLVYTVPSPSLSKSLTFGSIDFFQAGYVLRCSGNAQTKRQVLVHPASRAAARFVLLLLVYQRPSSTLKHCWDLTEIDSELSFHFHPLTMKNENFLDWTFLLYNGWGALIHYQMFTSSVKSIHWAPIFVCHYHNFSPFCSVDRILFVLLHTFLQSNLSIFSWKDMNKSGKIRCSIFLMVLLKLAFRTFAVPLVHWMLSWDCSKSSAVLITYNVGVIVLEANMDLENKVEFNTK